jgi:pantothenate kinase-related protein Tda10
MEILALQVGLTKAEPICSYCYEWQKQQEKHIHTQTNQGEKDERRQP